MKREIAYRLLRILTVIIFLIVASSFRSVVHESYEDASKIREGLGANLQIAQISSAINQKNSMPVNDEVGSKKEGYKFKVTNTSSKSKEFTFALIDDSSKEDEKLPYQNIRYQIIKDGKVVITDNINENGYLYKDSLDGKTECIYEVKFWIDIDSGEEIFGKRFSSKIALI